MCVCSTRNEDLILKTVNYSYLTSSKRISSSPSTPVPREEYCPYIVVSCDPAAKEKDGLPKGLLLLDTY